MPHLTLRKLKDSDIPTLAKLANNKKIWNNVRDHMPQPYNEEHARDFIMKTQKNESDHVYCIDVDSHMIGMCGLHVQSDVHRIAAELGYWIGEPFWGNGYASEAVHLLLKIGFKDLGLIRIFAGVYDYNQASKNVLLKNGFQFEGTAKSHVFKNGKVWDMDCYGITAIENIKTWEANFKSDGV